MKHDEDCGRRMRRCGLWAMVLLCLARPAFAQEDAAVLPAPTSSEARPAAAALPTVEDRSAIRTEDRLKTPLRLSRLLEELSENLSWGGYFRNETAYRVVRPSAFTKILNILQLEGRYRLGPTVSISGRLRAFYDMVYDIESIDSISPRKGPENILPEDLSQEQIAALSIRNLRNVEIRQKEIELKELYLDVNFRRADLRIGRQIVRWGVVEGSRVTDEINPLDFQELILRDIDDRYIPLFMVKGDYYIGAGSLELIWIPEIRGHEPAPRESEWEQFRFLPNLVEPENAWDDFPDHLDNSEIAVRYRHVFRWAEISLSYFYTWDDFPASFRTLSRLGFAFAQAPTIAFEPRYKRLRIYGATFSKSLPGFVLNAEATYTVGKNFGARFEGLTSLGSDPTFGVLERDLVKYAIGLDLNPFGFDLSPAVIQQLVLDHDRRLIQDRLDTVAALFVRKAMLHNLFAAQLLVLYFFNDQDWLVRPRFYHNVTERVRLSVGADIFEGKIGSGIPGEFHFIGFFDNNDRVYFDVTYSF